LIGRRICCPRELKKMANLKTIHGRTLEVNLFGAPGRLVNLTKLRQDARIWTVCTGNVSADVLMGRKPGEQQKR
jgi:hypothetical protein